MAKKHNAGDEMRNTDATREPKVAKMSRKESAELPEGRAAALKASPRAKAER